MIGSLVTFLQNCTLADLRPQSLKNSESLEKDKAIQVLSKNPKLYLDSPNWNNIKKLRIKLTDSWKSSFVRSLTVLSENDQEMNLEINLEEGSIEAEFTSGKDKGKIFGVEKSKTYMKISGEKKFEDDSKSKVYFESLSLYLRLPLILLKLPVLSYSGTENRSGKDYEKVFGTNGNLKPDSTHDQYLAWIQNNDGIITDVQFTYREVFSFYSGNLKYENYKEIDGRLFPMLVSIQGKPDDDSYVHKLIVKELEFLK